MSTSSSTSVLKQKIMWSLDHLPPEGLREISSFLDYLRFKLKKEKTSTVHYLPIKLGGLWKNEKITDLDIEETRKEMWQNFGNN